jgi:hypothetical protein
MTWTIYRRDRHLEVDLDGGVHGTQWEELLDDIARRLNMIERVIFLVPLSFEQVEQAEHLDLLVQVLTARGVNVERRHLG